MVSFIDYLERGRHAEAYREIENSGLNSAGRDGVLEMLIMHLCTKFLKNCEMLDYCEKFHDPEKRGAMRRWVIVQRPDLVYGKVDRGEIVKALDSEGNTVTRALGWNFLNRVEKKPSAVQAAQRF